MIKVVVLEFALNPMVDPSYNRFIKFDIDDGKDFCYHSRISADAFFHGRHKRNQSPQYLYVNRHEDEHQREIELWDGMMEKYPNIGDIFRTVPVIEVSNLWEFYKLIGYDYKTKKWVPCTPLK